MKPGVQKNNKPGPEGAIALFKSFKPFHALIHYYVDLSCFLILGENNHEWWALNRRKRLSSLYAMEVQYRSVQARDKAMGEAFERAIRTRKCVRVERLGFVDFLVPVVRGKSIKGFVQAGAFAEKAPSLASIERNWRELSGMEPSPLLPEYRDFVRTILEIPVLEGKLGPALQESMELYAALLSGEASPEKVEKRSLELLYTVVSKGLPHSYFMDWAMGRPTSESTPAWAWHMGNWGWIRDEIGLIRVPTTAIVVMPRVLQRGDSWAEERLKVAAFQRKAFRHAQTLPETVAGSLDTYGAVYACSARPGLSRLAGRQEIEALARQIRDFAQKELGGPVLVSVGETVAPGDSLWRSYRQAVLALHSAAASSKGVVFAAEIEAEAPTRLGQSRLQRGMDELERAFEKQDGAEIQLWQEAIMSLALEIAFYSPSEIRLHFHHAVGRACSALARRMGLSSAESQRLRDSAASELDGAGSVQEMVAAFRDAIGRLRDEPSRTEALKRRLGLQEILARINERPGESLPLARLASLAGVSISSFSREFKRVTGKGFEAYLQERRLEQARRLLRGGNLAVAKVARDCGFKSTSYFSRLFRKKSGSSPDQFRKKARRPEAFL